MRIRASGLRPALAAAFLAVGWPCLGSAGEPGPSLSEVLERAAAYVVDYDTALGNVIGRERYVQDVYEKVRRGYWERRNAATRDWRLVRRTALVADYGLVLVEGFEERFGLRDVIERDGKPLPRDDERLASLLQELPADPAQRWRVLSGYSTRFDVGVRRNVNIPTFALLILRPERRAGFRFRRDGSGTVHGVGAWRIAFDEERSPTLVTSGRGDDMPSRGKLWIEPATGRVLRTELLTEGKGRVTQARFEVTFRDEPRLGIWVPEKMKERILSGNITTIGKADYSDFRRFDVELGVQLEE